MTGEQLHRLWCGAYFTPMNPDDQEKWNTLATRVALVQEDVLIRDPDPRVTEAHAREEKLREIHGKLTSYRDADASRR